MKLHEVREIHKKTEQAYTRPFHYPFWFIEKESRLLTFQQSNKDYKSELDYKFTIDDIDSDDWELEPLPDDKPKVGDRVVVDLILTNVVNDSIEFKKEGTVIQRKISLENGEVVYHVILDDCHLKEGLFPEKYVKKIKEKTEDEKDKEDLEGLPEVENKVEEVYPTFTSTTPNVRYKTLEDVIISKYIEQDKKDLELLDNIIDCAIFPGSDRAILARIIKRKLFDNTK